MHSLQSPGQQKQEKGGKKRFFFKWALGRYSPKDAQRWHLPIFNARLLRNQGCANINNNGGVGHISSRVFHRHTGLCIHLVMEKSSFESRSRGAISPLLTDICGCAGGLFFAYPSLSCCVLGRLQRYAPAKLPQKQQQHDGGCSSQLHRVWSERK